MLVLAASGCHSLLSPPDGGHQMGAKDMSVPVGADMTTADLDMGSTGADMVACQPTVSSCIGLCGPIPDPCLGRDVQCGGCAQTEVCNLATHLCETPKATCTALGAKCGNARNSCGTRLFCGDCPAGQECNNDTNQCQACQYNLGTPQMPNSAGVQAACAKQGFECGPAWLGCGPEDTIFDCGTCPSGATPVCNPYFHVCEPKCSPKPMMQACADALANHGIECGVIDDGCGGFIDCGSSACKPGTACGAQGDPGRCEPTEKPSECVALGKNCGVIKSECGGNVDCGKCQAPQVCNPNGICGAPCTPLTCATITNPPTCGTVPDGCGGTVGPCGMCPNPQSNYICVNNTCCPKRTCAGYYKGMCGTKLDDGCGGTVNCACGSGGTCSATTPGTTGTCCVNTNVCQPGTCNTTVTNSCTNKTTPCVCASGQWCDTTTSPGTCRDCTAFPGISHEPGQLNDVCSNGPAFDNDTVSCPCIGSLACSNNGTVVSGNQTGKCCQDTACNGVNCGTGFTNSCTGQKESCGCGNGSFCNSNNMCQPLNQCSMFTTGMAGAQCGAFPAGNGTNLYCPCGNGMECVVAGSPGHIAGGNETGVCCNPTRDSCGSRCNLPGPITTDSCLNTTQTCQCDPQHYCNMPSNGTCQAYLICANYQPNGGKGPPPPATMPPDQCGTLSDGNGGTINCPCYTGPGYANNMCVGGTCQCVPNKTCTSCSDNGASDGCGGTKTCSCPDGANAHNTVCDPSGATVDGFGCCYPYTIGPPAHLPAGWPAQGPPGSLGKPTPICTPPMADGCGGSFSIPCPANNPNGDSTTDTSWPNVQCTTQSGGYGLCTCTPTPCINLPHPTGVNDDDGCGNIKNCGT